jgi:hypothetical protein
LKCNDSIPLLHDNVESHNQNLKQKMHWFICNWIYCLKRLFTAKTHGNEKVYCTVVLTECVFMHIPSWNFLKLCFNIPTSNGRTNTNLILFWFALVRSNTTTLLITLHFQCEHVEWWRNIPEGENVGTVQYHRSILCLDYTTPMDDITPMWTQALLFRRKPRWSPYSGHATLLVTLSLWSRHLGFIHFLQLQQLMLWLPSSYSSEIEPRGDIPTYQSTRCVATVKCWKHLHRNDSFNVLHISLL